MTRYTVTGTIPGQGKVQHVIRAKTAAAARAHFLRAHPTALSVSAKAIKQVPA